MERFLIRTNESKDEKLELTGKIREFLISRGKTVAFELIDEKRIREEEKAVRFKDGEEPDLVIVLGGDGTMLRAARDFMFEKIPLIGVNLGSLGYLTEIEKDHVIPALEKILNGDYMIEERMMLEGTFVKDGVETAHVRALNDINVLKDNPFRAIGLKIYVNDKYLWDFSGDGIIISSPTGSTGYNLSAGGPIVEPGADMLVLTPVSPHTLMTRSIILSPKDVIRIELKGPVGGMPQKAVASADSANRFELSSGDSFVVKRSAKRTKFVSVESLSFLEKLSRKLT